MRYAIYGAGSLGTVLGAFLTKNGVEIELVNHNADHIRALKENGARVKGTVDLTVPVKALRPEEMEGLYDVIFLLTKQTGNREAAAFLKPFLAPDGVIAVMQNGIPEPDIAEVVGQEHVVSCVVEWGATLTGPGEVTLTSDPDSLSFHMGRMQGITDAQFDRVKGMLEKMCPVYTEENLMGARWSKLLINAAFSGIGTALGGVFGDVSEGREAKGLALRCMKECIDVGRAACVTFAPVQGKDITRLFYYKTPVKKAIGRLILPITMKKHRLIEPSMLQDLKKGKPCEIDAINGVVCREGRKYGVPTPVNDRIVDTVKKIQAGELKAEPKNIALFRNLK